MNRPDFDKLYQASATELDPAKREKNLQDAEAIIIDQDMGIFLYVTPSVYAMNKNVQGFIAREDQIIEPQNMTVTR